MAEVQKSTESGEMTQRFIEFAMMQAQHAALFMGQTPDPRGESPEINLDLAKMFIDQLLMIREKTRGNLSSEEQQVLNGLISNLQMTFFEVAQKEKGGGTVAAGAAAPPPAGEQAKVEEEPRPAAPEEEGKKKFSKSYGS